MLSLFAAIIVGFIVYAMMDDRTNSEGLKILVSFVASLFWQLALFIFAILCILHYLKKFLFSSV